MSKITHSDLAKILVSTIFALMLAACGNGSDPLVPIDDPTDPGGGGGAGTPPDAPLGAHVVSGDSDNSDVQNTISWILDPDATSYTVYWDNAPGVTENSSVVVPTLQGTRHIVHSGVDVLAGNSYYYRVQASSADGTSSLSDEVAGTPQQSISSNQLNDVAWNGVNTLVAVGDSGTILASRNGTSDAWVDVSAANVPEALEGVTWDGINAQFLIVGAGSTVLTGDGATWVQEDLSNLQGSRNLKDVAWLGDRYIAVGNNGAILTSNGDGGSWTLQDAGANVGNTAFNAVGYDSNTIVVVGSNGTILTSDDAVTWTELVKLVNNDLNDITWDGNQFIIVGSNDTLLTSPDGTTWTALSPGTSDINLVAVTQWDAGLPQAPIATAAGSSGTFVLNPDDDPGTLVRTGTTEQLGGVIQVDDGTAVAYFVIVGNDGTVLTAQYQ